MLNQNKKLYSYLCDTKEENQELDSIFKECDNEWDRLTQYRKSRISRSIGQVSVEYIKGLICKNDLNVLKDILQKMFGDFIDEGDIKNFSIKSKQNLEIIDKIINLHKKYSLEQLHNLLLVV